MSRFFIRLSRHTRQTAGRGLTQLKLARCVSGGGKKPYKQKGTGNARQGSRRAPNHAGGGVSHGPQPRSYRQNVPVKVKRLALKVALSDKVRHNRLIVVDDFKLAGYSTKAINKILASFKAPLALLADERRDDLLYKSTRNIHGAESLRPSDLNAENILRL